jgi:putative transcriptional regulator
MKNKVKEIRSSIDMPQSQLASMCDVSRQTIHAIETSKYQPSVTLALKISRAFKMKVDEVFKLEKDD